MKRFLSVVLALFIVVGTVPVFEITSSAASESDLTFTLNNDNVSYSVSDCNTEATGDLVIPDTYNDLPVTSIGYEAFCFCNKLTSITIPKSVTRIRGNAFYFCESLTSITIPDSVISIGDSAFYYCQSLTSITIPDSVTSIGKRAFNHCVSLKKINVDSENSYFTDVAGILFNVNKTKLIKYPAGMTETSYVIPDSVTNIDDSTFHFCKNLISVTIPDSVTSIGWFAFTGCEKLTSIIIPDSVTSISGYAFNGCMSLISVIIPDGVTSIGEYAFSTCASLTSITIPDSVTSIGEYAFGSCDSFTDVFYLGSESEWGKIDIDTSNSKLQEVKKHYNCTQTIAGTCLIGITSTFVCPECSASISQKKSVEHKFTDGRCSVCHIKESTLIESSHPYGNNLEKLYFIEKKGAETVTILFSEDTELENSYDKIYIYDGNANLVGTYTGTQLQSNQIIITGDTVKIVLDTDGSVTKYGFKVVDIFAKFENCTHSETMVENAIAPTCTETGMSGDIYCAYCDKLIEKSTTISATGHSYGDWIVTMEPTCTENGIAKKVCNSCGNEKFTDTVVVDSNLYPESPHNYGNNISETYNFSYPLAVSLELTFSNSTLTETGYDYIYIYDKNGDQCGKYSGASLAGTTISIEGDSFSIKLTSDGSYTKYGFSFDSIVADCIWDAVKSPGHQYCEWIIDRLATSNTPGERHKTCSVCGDTVTDNNVDYQYFDINFIPGGGSCDEEMRTVISEAPIGELPEAKKSNYIFKGWTYTNGGTDFVTEEDIVTSDLTLYGSWELIGPESIEITDMPLKTVYFINDMLETRGLKLLVTYNDGSTKTITSGFEAEYDFSASGETDVTISYTENNKTAKTTFTAYVNEPAHIYSEELECNAGETVDVPILIENNPGVSGFTIYMTYDDSVFTPVCVNDNDLSGYGMLDDNIGYSTDNTVQVSWSGTENYYEDCELFNITFEVSGELDVRGDYDFDITYEPSDTFDENMNEVALECEGTTVNVINEEKPPVELGGDLIDAVAGKYVDIPVNVLNNNGLAGSDVVINYNSEVFTFVKVTSDLATVTADSSVADELSVNLKTVKESSDGTLFKVRFKIKEFYSGKENLIITSSISNVFSDDILVDITNPMANMPAEIYSDEISGDIGDTVLVPVYISNNHGLLGFKIRVTFDSTLLTPASYCKAEAIVSGCGTVSNNISANVKKGRNYFDVIFYGDEEFSESGKMFTLKFTVQEAIPMNTSIKLDYVQADTYTEVDGVEKDVELNCNNVNFGIGGAFVSGNTVYLNKLQNASTIDLLNWLPAADGGSIENIKTNVGSFYGTGTTFDYISDDGTTEEYNVVVKGDIDGDGVIDVLDAAQAYLASNQFTELSEAQQDAADLTGDSEVTVEDYSATVNLVLS